MGMYDKNISEEKKASLEFAEDARETEWQYPSFALKVFHGIVDWKLINPFPKQDEKEKEEGDVFIAKLKKVLEEKVDPDQVDLTGIIPDEAYKALAEIGAFAIKLPKEYGGVGLSQVNYNRAMHMVASYCGSTAVLLSAHQSIGVPQPLKLFGTPEQKKKYFPLFAKGMVSAFALTEPEAGSDPRNMKTTATPVDGGRNFVLNGEKLWCTNGLVAGVLVVMAVTPPKIINGKERKQITAFIVDTNSPGFEIVHRCRFMGLNGIQNGLIRFNNVKVPAENIILGEGEGLRLALMTLNTGRLTLPAASVGIARWCLYVSREWCTKRVQWGSAIGEHESIALKLGYIASHTFAMEAMTWLTSAMADDKKRDIRLEASIAKYFCTEHSWKIVDQTLQIRGGSGYERQSSLKARGVPSWAVERTMRDVRINLIIEGTSEIMHLFIAREALDPHLSRIKPLLTSKDPGKILGALIGAAKYYMFWYPKLWLPPLTADDYNQLPKPLDAHMRYVRKASKQLARFIFHNMMKYQQKLESKQAILNRAVDIGTELFAIAATCSYANSLIKEKKGEENCLDLANLFCLQAQKRIEATFKESAVNDDRLSLSIAKKVLKKEFAWMETGIIK